MKPAAVEIRALPPELQAVALARMAHEAALDRKALGLPPVAVRQVLACGCPADAPVVETDGRAWCPRCSPEASP